MTGQPVPQAFRSLSRTTGQTSTLLREGQGKAGRAALLAGIAPTWAAKHFGLPLAAMRKVLEANG